MKKLFIFFFSFCSVSLLAQEKTYLSYFEAHNMNKNFQISTTRIFRAYLLQEKRYVPAPLDPIPDSLPAIESYQQTWDHAKRLGVNYFIKGELDRLGETVLINISLYKTLDGSTVWTDLLKASNPEDLDPILQKLAKSLGTTDKASGELEDVALNNYESRQSKQALANTYLGISVGGAFVNSRIQSQSLPAGFGISISHDTRKYIADIAGEAYFGPIALYFLNIAVSYPFKSKNNTPYIGGGLGVGGIHVLDNKELYNFNGTPYLGTVERNGGGLLLNAGAGYIFSRHSSVRLRAGAKLIMPLFKINGLIPFGGVFNFEIGFGR